MLAPGDPLEDFHAVPQVLRRAVPLSIVDAVLDADVCAALIGSADGLWFASPSHQPTAGGDGYELAVDDARKRRLDHQLADGELMDAVVEQLQRRLLPEVARGFALHATSFERPKVVRYPTGGFFAGHRDNASPDAAHRRLAVTVNLDDGYEGGELEFPELGPERYAPSRGAAIVFSCALYHSVAPVTRGERHALVTFLW